MKQTSIKNVFLLVLTAMIWGAAFVAQSAGMEYVGPFTFLATRSYLGGLVLLPVIPFLDKVNKTDTSSLKEISYKKTLIKGGVFAGLAMMLASIIQQIGLQFTTVGKAGFLTAMYVLFVPFASLLIFHKKLQTRIWFCVFLAVTGMAFLCLSKTARFEFGDGLELLCAVFYCGHILILDHFTEKVDPVRLSCIQFFVCAFLCTIPMIILEHPTMHLILQAWLPIAYAGILSSGVAYTLQAVAQKKCDPTIASLIMCLESVFSVVFGWIILHQNLTLKEGVGCILMFIAIILANLPSKKKD